MSGEQHPNGIDDRRFVGTCLRVGQTEADPAKSYEAGECQESRHQPERWAAELRRDHERMRARPAIEDPISANGSVAITSTNGMTLIWDGKSDSGAIVTNGHYQVEVHYTDGKGGEQIVTRGLVVQSANSPITNGNVFAGPNILKGGVNSTLIQVYSNTNYTLEARLYNTAGELIRQAVKKDFYIVTPGVRPATAGTVRCIQGDVRDIVAVNESAQPGKLGDDVRATREPRHAGAPGGAAFRRKVFPHPCMLQNEGHLGT
jgi:hypothetical protein